jgi:hypothetical protein
MDMQKHFKRLKKGILQFPVLYRMIIWCLALSWKASKFYTIVRVLSEAVIPILTVVAAFIGRHIINILAGQDAFNNTRQILLLLLIGLIIIGIARQIATKAMTYCQSMHEDALNARVSLMLMDKALFVDLEY